MTVAYSYAKATVKINSKYCRYMFYEYSLMVLVRVSDKVCFQS